MPASPTKHCPENKVEMQNKESLKRRRDRSSSFKTVLKNQASASSACNLSFGKFVHLKVFDRTAIEMSKERAIVKQLSLQDRIPQESILMKDESQD